MSIRMLARELYRLMHQVEMREKELAQTPMAQRGAVAERLRKLRAERDRIRRMLDGRIDR